MLNFQAHIFWQPFCRTFRYKPQNGEFNQSLRPETTQKQKTMNINNLTIKAQEVLQSAMNQNFIPVVDDLGNFTGIVTRKDIIRYFAERKDAAEPQPLRKIV